MRQISDVAIIGAGPYGLSLAAHLRAAGLSFRIFGHPMTTWRAHMPKDMLLKSDGFASSLSAPAPDSTLRAFCAANGHAYADEDAPVRLDVFNAYADSFQRRFVPSLETKEVVALERRGDAFELVLDDGEPVEVRSVVIAAGISWFAHLPKELAPVPVHLKSHSSQHSDGLEFHRRDVVVLGGGASAIDLAAHLHDCGAKVRIVTRRRALAFHKRGSADRSVLSRILAPSSGVGPGWRSFLCVHAPWLFHRMPERLRLRATRNHLGPAAGWFMRDRIEGRVPVLTGLRLTRSEFKDGRVRLHLADADGASQTLNCEHVIAATGYRPDMQRLPFLPTALCAQIAQVENTPILSPRFETSVRGLYVIGPAAANSFGPLMRFMVGAEYTSPLLARHLRRRLSRRRRESEGQPALKPA